MPVCKLNTGDYDQMYVICKNFHDGIVLIDSISLQFEVDIYNYRA